jgi:hypothetical protein
MFIERMNSVSYIHEDAVTKEASVVSTLTPETHVKQKQQYKYEKQQEHEEFT